MKCIKCFQEIRKVQILSPLWSAAAGRGGRGPGEYTGAGGRSCRQRGTAERGAAGEYRTAGKRGTAGDAVAQQTDAAASQAESQTYSEPQPQYQDAQSQYSGAGYQDSYNAGYQNNQSYQDSAHISVEL